MNGTFQVDSNNNNIIKRINSTSLENNGNFSISGNNQSLFLTNTSVINRGSLTLFGNYSLYGYSTSSLTNLGNVVISPSSSLSLSSSLSFVNSKLVEVGEGASVSLQVPSTNSGELRMARNVLVTCSEAVYNFLNSSVVSGNGTLQFLQSTANLYHASTFNY